jgi:branched-chain amino acid transport system substrate-binding protein
MLKFIAFNLLLALALGSPALAAEPPPIKVAAIGPYTGGSAPMGISMLDGMKLAVTEIGREGGVLGRRFILVERNDMAKNERGALIAEALTRDRSVVAALGLVNTGVTLAAAPYFEQARIPLIVNVATGSQITQLFAPPEYHENYIFRTSASTAIEVGMIADAAVRAGATRISLFADTTPYGQTGRRDLLGALARRHLVPVSVEKFNVGDTDMTPQLKRARAAGARVLLTYGIGPELAAIANGRSRMGWPVPIIGAWTLSMSNFIDRAGANGEGAIMPQTFIQEGDTPRRRAFIAAFQAMFGAGRIPSPPSAAQGYDSVYLLAAAIEQARSTDGPAIRAALENLKRPVEGVIKTYDHPFSATQHEAISRSDVVYGIVRDGRVERLLP